ncbi:OsmC family protein [Acetobacter syzygii]|uniref:OsmC family peroxiredoxin n=1 Tax=Acetobacter syzygii TaxID=146476 RepID=A0A270BU49_9PROT|nr:OsmC family protein [Acetobacter syzygii]NSL91872.1 OsmC family protein [Acetobacter syzygii]PAL28374.1 OsmC family peroxiredoxin [Acetobacter syzygii]PAL28802.1 OsmC family peroxiredoxin [Acetobacter syzygii]GAN71191.1 osmotically inducible peroxiredoxin OsmC [Acetobacter syzygii]GBR63601.1 osmotically inducible protein OsmC [Acetobacter syzygii NRIC 0483]
MSSIVKHGSAHWEGAIKTGKGTVSTQSGALDRQPYGFNTRFEGQPGTNPEELLGAAHAACFSMALSLILGNAGLTATSIDTQADVTLSKTDAGFEIASVALTLKANIPGATQEQFLELANQAKEGCPVSKLFRATITLDATLIA